MYLFISPENMEYFDVVDRMLNPLAENAHRVK